MNLMIIKIDEFVTYLHTNSHDKGLNFEGLKHA